MELTIPGFKKPIQISTESSNIKQNRVREYFENPIKLPNGADKKKWRLAVEGQVKEQVKFE